MPFLSHLEAQHERYVEVNGHPLGPAPVWNPTFVPDPLAAPTTLRRRLDAAAGLLRMALWVLVRR